MTASISERPEGAALDPWFYEVSIDTSTFGPVSAYIADGLRTVHRLEVQGVMAYRKWDYVNKGRSYLDGARDKIASDLAQLVGGFVPAAALWQAHGEAGCVQKEPPHFKQTLYLLLKAYEEATPNEQDELAGLISEAYDPMSCFLDVWFGNTDRFRNGKNTLVSENANSTTIWIIDFNNSMGQGHKAWFTSGATSHELSKDTPPAPYIIANRPEWLSRLQNEADTLQKRLNAVKDEEIEMICRRTFDFSPYVEYNEVGSQMAACLKSRKNAVRDWAAELFAQ